MGAEECPSGTHVWNGNIAVNIPKPINKNGKNIATHQTLYLYLKQIEDIIGRNQWCSYYNFASYGAKIAGATDIDTFPELLALLPSCVKKQVTITPVSVTDSELKDRVLEYIRAGKL